MEGRYGGERKTDKESRNKGKQEGKKSVGMRGRRRLNGLIDRAGEAGH